MSQSCINCPSLMGGDEFLALADLTDEPFHTDWIVCSRYGHVLGRNDKVQDELAERHGATCPSFGLDRPENVNVPALKLGVYEPDTGLLVPTALTERPASCWECTKYDSTFHACAAKGTVVFLSQRGAVAKACSFGRRGISGNSVDEMLDGWTSGSQTDFVSVSVTPSTTAAAPSPPTPTPALLKIIEPVDYTSDAPVTKEHEEQGVMAWRAVLTPRGRTHHLPIFRTDFIPEEFRHLIPSTSSEYGDPSLYVDHNGLLVEFAVQVYLKDMNLCLIGEPGSGKTEGARSIAWTVNLPFRRLTYNEGSEPDQFLGLYQYGPYTYYFPDGTSEERVGTHFVPGELPRAWVEIGVTLSDEPNLATEAIFQSYRSMNDSSRTIKVYGESYKRNDYQFHLMAINPHWDFRNIGAKPLAAADSRRLAFFWMADPDEDMRKSIIEQSLLKLDNVVLDVAVLRAIQEAGKDLRQLAADQHLPDFWTLSQEIKVARLIEDFGLEGAYRRAYFNYIDPKTAETAMAAIKSHIPYGVEWS